MPIGISPTAMNKLAHPMGEKNSAKSALKNNIVFSLSTISTTSMGEIN